MSSCVLCSVQEDRGRYEALLSTETLRLPACLPLCLPGRLVGWPCCRETHQCPFLCLSIIGYGRFSQPERRKATWRSKRRGQRRQKWGREKKKRKKEEEGRERLVTMFWRGDKTKKQGLRSARGTKPECWMGFGVYFLVLSFCLQGSQVNFQLFDLSFGEYTRIPTFLSLIHSQFFGSLHLN